MVETTTVQDEKPRLDKKEVMSDVLYTAVKGIGLAALKAFTNLRIEGEENIPYIGKAILTTISKNVMRDMLVISQATGRKIHFMLSPKIMKHAVAGPILKTLGMIRGTRDKEDTEPIEKIFEILNEKGDLVAMTPEARFDREVQIKSLAAIIKFAIVGEASIIPIAIFGESTKLFNIIPAKGLVVKVGTPLNVDKRLNREKYRAQRYELAEDIINIIDTLKERPEESE